VCVLQSYLDVGLQNFFLSPDCALLEQFAGSARWFTSLNNFKRLLEQIDLEVLYCAVTDCVLKLVLDSCFEDF